MKSALVILLLGVLAHSYEIPWKNIPPVFSSSYYETLRASNARNSSKRVHAPNEAVEQHIDVKIDHFDRTDSRMYQMVRLLLVIDVQ